MSGKSGPEMAAEVHDWLRQEKAHNLNRSAAYHAAMKEAWRVFGDATQAAREQHGGDRVAHQQAVDAAKKVFADMSAEADRLDGVLMEYGRHIVRRAALGGRWGGSMPEAHDMERGARAVVSDPDYRSQVAHDALVWASDHGDAVDSAIVLEALDRLAAQS